uniref:Uncharacterized protein n=1 Tax=Anguilla anguilla TaxID=7936 RepID=A0A0E9Q8N0_ANGAN
MFPYANQHEQAHALFWVQTTCSL